VRKQPLAEQVVVVTGASSGLGRAIARLAAERGARLALAGRNADGLDAAVAEARARGAEAIGVQGDLEHEDEAAVLVERAVDRFGRIDSFVRCHMLTVYAEVEELEPAELRRVLDVNFTSGVLCYLAALPHLQETRGTFVDVNSALAYRGIPLQAAYCASKAALRTFLESARVEQERHGTGVDVSVVLPAAINTPQFDRGRTKLGLQPRPVPPIYQPEPFAEAVLRCCEHPVRELPLGWAAQKLLWGQKLSPRAGDLVLLRTGWKGQTTGERKPAGAPDNLFEPMRGDPGARGRFDGDARASTTWTALRLRPRLATLLALLGAAAPVAAAAAAQRRTGRPGRVRRAARIG
jgi:NAD(P)-dependent dehydrogenase (short-subunit alcohol dehydrogenase family)